MGGFVLACLFLTACGGSSATPSATSTPLPAAATGDAQVVTQSLDVMRVGDKVTIRLSGVPVDEGYIIEVQIPQSGDISVPLLSRSFHAVGISTADLSSSIIDAYKAEKIYTNPNVSVISEERYVSIGGEVKLPQRVLYTSDLTLLGVINAGGGFTEYANKKMVRILRGQQVMQVDAVAAAKKPGADPPLYAGDQIYVPRTIF